MTAPSLPRVARPVGRRVAAPVVAVATQRPAEATPPTITSDDQGGDDPSLDFTTTLDTPGEAPARAAEEPITDPAPEADANPEPGWVTEPGRVTEPVAATHAPVDPATRPKTAPIAATAATTVPTPASPAAGGLRTLVVVRNGVIDYDESTVQILDMDNLSGAGAHDLADALLALKGAGRSTIKDTAFAELMAMFNTAIS